jgi:hypothetical protein
LSFFSAINHCYGANGRDLKRVDLKSLLFDFELFQVLTEISFVNHLKSKFDTFVSTLVEEKKTGIKISIIAIFFYTDTRITFIFTCLEHEQSSSLFDVKTFQVASINTTDPSISINIYLEVKSNKVTYV